MTNACLISSARTCVMDILRHTRYSSVVLLWNSEILVTVDGQTDSNSNRKHCKMMLWDVTRCDVTSHETCHKINDITPDFVISCRPRRPLVCCPSLSRKTNESLVQSIFRLHRLSFRVSSSHVRASAVKTSLDEVSANTVPLLNLLKRACCAGVLGFFILNGTTPPPPQT